MGGGLHFSLFALLFLFASSWKLVSPSSLFVCYSIRASHLCGGAVSAVGDLHRHVVVGASSRIQPAGDGDGSCVPLDVEVFLLVTS